MNNEDRKEIIVKGLILGLILFASTIIQLLITKDMQHLEVVATLLIPIILGYCILGIFIRWMVYRSTIRKEGPNMFSGISVIYWIFMLSTLFIAGSYFIPQVIRYAVLANVIALLLVWYVNTKYLKNIAKELNTGLGYCRRTLVEDLAEKPQTEDMFMEEIEKYCEKNHLFLEILEYGIPAKIKMNNIPYTVNLGQYYSVVGTLTYTLEIHNVPSKTNNNFN